MLNKRWAYLGLRFVEARFLRLCFCICNEWMRFQRNQESQRVAYVVFLSGNWRTQWQSVHFTSRPAKFNSGLWSRRKHDTTPELFFSWTCLQLRSFIMAQKPPSTKSFSDRFWHRRRWWVKILFQKQYESFSLLPMLLFNRKINRNVGLFVLLFLLIVAI